jgi:hypothetical protein
MAMAMNSVVILSEAKDLSRELFVSRKILRCAQNDTGAALKVVKARGFHGNGNELCCHPERSEGSSPGSCSFLVRFLAAPRMTLALPLRLSKPGAFMPMAMNSVVILSGAKDLYPGVVRFS